MSSIPVPDEHTVFSSSRRLDDVDVLAWPVLSQHALDLLRSAGEVLHPAPGELLWDAGDPYDLYLVLAGGVLLVDCRDDRVVFVVEEGDFVAELGMLMGQRAFFSGVAMEDTAVVRVRVEALRVFDQMVRPEPILLLITVGQRFADLNPLFGRLRRRDLGIFVALLVVEDAEGHRHHVKAVEVTVLAHGIVG